MVREKEGGVRRGISNAIVILATLLILLVGFASYAYIGASTVNYAKRVEEEVRHQALLESELIRIYLWSENRSLSGAPRITLLNAWGRDSYVKYLIVVNKAYEPIREIVFNPPLQVPASSRVELSPASIGLNYATFKDMADNVAGVYIYTENGNSFGSTWGHPREENIVGATTAVASSTVNTTAWHIPVIYGDQATTVSLYETLPYPEEWDAPALIVAENIFESAPRSCIPSITVVPCFPSSRNIPECYREEFKWVERYGNERPKAGGPTAFPARWRVNGVDVQPMFTWYLAENPLKGIYVREVYERDEYYYWRLKCRLTVIYVLTNAQMQGQGNHRIYIYSGEVQDGTIITKTKVTATFKEYIYLTDGRTTTTLTHEFPTIRQDSVTYTCTLTHTFVGGYTQYVWLCPFDHEPFQRRTTTSWRSIFYPTFHLKVKTTFTYTTKIPEGAPFTTIVTTKTTIPSFHEEYVTTFMRTWVVRDTIRMTLVYIWNEPPTLVTTYRGTTLTYRAPYTQTVYDSVQPSATITLLAPYTTTFNLSKPEMQYVMTLTPISTMTAQAVEPGEVISGNYTHIYFKLTMPYYKITRYYKIAAINSEFYPISRGGISPSYPELNPSRVVCDIVRKCSSGADGTTECKYEEICRSAN